MNKASNGGRNNETSALAALEVCPKIYERYPIVVEALFFDGSLQAKLDIRLWLQRCLSSSYQKQLESYSSQEESIVLPTLEGPAILKPGEYVVRGMLGEWFPLRKSEFEALFTLVSQDRLMTLSHMFPRARCV